VLLCSERRRLREVCPLPREERSLTEPLRDRRRKRGRRRKGGRARRREERRMKFKWQGEAEKRRVGIMKVSFHNIH